MLDTSGIADASSPFSTQTMLPTTMISLFHQRTPKLKATSCSSSGRPTHQRIRLESFEIASWERRKCRVRQVRSA